MKLFITLVVIGFFKNFTLSGNNKKTFYFICELYKAKNIFRILSVEFKLYLYAVFMSGYFKV